MGETWKRNWKLLGNDLPDIDSTQEGPDMVRFEDLTGVSTNASGLDGYPLDGPLASGDIYVFDGDSWVPTNVDDVTIGFIDTVVGTSGVTASETDGTSTVAFDVDSLTASQLDALISAIVADPTALAALKAAAQQWRAIDQGPGATKSITVPADTLAVDGDKIEFRVAGNIGTGNGVSVLVDGTDIMPQLAGVALESAGASGGGNWEMTGSIIRISAGQVVVTAALRVQGSDADVGSTLETWVTDLDTLGITLSGSFTIAASYDTAGTGTISIAEGHKV